MSCDVFLADLQDVLGEGWEDHPEGQKLKYEGDAFRDKLDAAPRFKAWQEEVLQVNREAMTLFNAGDPLSLTTTRSSNLNYY